jgi:hypothetical protein
VRSDFVCLQASSLLSGSDVIPAQFVLLSAYIELASGEEMMLLSNLSELVLETLSVLMHTHAGHAALAVEIIKKRCLFSFGGGDKKTSKIKLLRQ